MANFFGKWVGLMIVRKNYMKNDSNDNTCSTDCVLKFINFILNNTKDDGFAACSAIDLSIKQYRINELRHSGQM